jgi:hypothetical protein
VNVASLDERAKNIFSLNGVSFNYKRRVLPSSSSEDGQDGEKLGEISRDGVADLNSTHFGFIAQEVEVSYPELVGVDSQGLRRVAYNAFVPLIIEGMKSQKNEFQDLVKDQRAHLQIVEDLKLRIDELSSESRSTINVKGLSATGAVSAHYDSWQLEDQEEEIGGNRRRMDDEDSAWRAKVIELEEEVAALKAKDKEQEEEVAALKAKGQEQEEEVAVQKEEVAALKAKGQEQEEQVAALRKLLNELLSKFETR